MSKILENRAKSAPIFADFLVGRRLFCRSTQVKSFVDRSADFGGFCHRWSVGRWSPNDRPTFWNLHHDIGRKSPDHRASIGRRSQDGRSMSFYKIIVGRQMPDIGRHSADCRPIIKCGLWYIVVMHVFTLFIGLNHALVLFWDSIHWALWTNSILFFCWISNWTIRMTFWNYVRSSHKKIETKY